MVLVRQTKQGWSSNQPHAADSLTLVADANSLDLPMPQTHHLFISHSSATKELARHFYYNAIANGLAPWYDEVLLELGDQLETELRHGIESSRSFLLLYFIAKRPWKRGGYLLRWRFPNPNFDLILRFGLLS
jgi:hypothetical protein